MFSKSFLQPITSWLVAGAFALLAGIGLLSASISRADAPVLEEVNFAAQAEEQPQQGLREVNMTLAGHHYRVEVAETPEQSEKGLMYRTALPQQHGMLFVFEPPRIVNFWMKNTKIPLDIVFLAKGSVVHVARSVQPCLGSPCATYSSRFVVDMVVELPAGTAEMDKIVPGTLAIVNLRPKAWLSGLHLAARNGQ